MSEHPSSIEQVVDYWQFKTGIGLLVLGIIMPLGGIPLVAYLSLSKMATALVTKVLLAGGETQGIVAIARLFRQIGLPQTVSQPRYFLGLILFVTPILFGWISVYISHWIPFYLNNQILSAVTGDILFITSLFVLGGDFWDKVRSLFIHSARVQFQ